MLPRQQDSLVSKAASKVLPGALTNRSQDSEVDNKAADYSGVKSGGAWKADNTQTLNDSTGGCSNPCACCTCCGLL